MTTTMNRFSMPSLLLRLEGVAVLGMAIVLYAMGGFSWWHFGLLLLVPDISMLPYAIDKRWGAIAYNMAHTYSGPLLLKVAALTLGSDFALQLALIWFAHIGMDRVLGYGLKYVAGFKETHLGRV